MARRWSALRAALGAALLAGAAGCPPPTEHVPFDPMPIDEVVTMVNSKNEQIDGTLQARGGRARGFFTDDKGARRSFSYDAALLIRPPRLMRFDLTALGKSYLLFGSNEKLYWVEVKPEIDTLWFGRHDEQLIPHAGELLIRPDLLVEALGLNALPVDTGGTNGPVQRITATHQQLLFIEYDPAFQGFIGKEYWIDRFDPRHVDRIVFRDVIGRVVMDSRLSNYKPIYRDGPALPRRIEIDWPTSKSRLVFTASGWRVLPHVDASHPGFIFPLDRGETFERVIDIDAEVNMQAPPIPPAVVPPDA